MSFTTRRIREEKPSRWKPVAKKLGSVLIRFGPLFSGLYRGWKIRKQEEVTHTARVRILKKILIILLAVLFGMIVLAGTVKALVVLRILTVQNFLNIAGSDLPQDKDGFTNFLLLGVGDKDHDGIDLTDTIMVVSMDPYKTKSAVMLSFPRDLYFMRSETMGSGRINELYRNRKHALRRDEGMDPATASITALKELSAEVGRVINMEIHHAVKVDFTAFVDIVDTLGGVDLDVPYDILDLEYPGPNYTFDPFIINEGPQHLDGATALKYARSRHTTSDFGRAVRQQQLLQALADKARTQGIASSPGKITSIFRILADHVETTMSLSEILGAAKFGEKIDRANIVNYTLNIATGFDSGIATPGGLLYTPPRADFNGASVLLPVSFPAFPITWKQITTFAEVVMRHRAIHLLKPQIAVLNAGAQTGMGRRLGNELIRHGFPDVEIDNANDDRRNPLKIPASIVVARTPEDADIAEFFGTLLALPVGTLPVGIVPEKQRQITIVLGENYSYASLQDLLSSAE